jgi:hypothetical protein
MSRKDRFARTLLPLNALARHPAQLGAQEDYPTHDHSAGTGTREPRADVKGPTRRVRSRSPSPTGGRKRARARNVIERSILLESRSGSAGAPAVDIVGRGGGIGAGGDGDQEVRLANEQSLPLRADPSGMAIERGRSSRRGRPRPARRGAQASRADAPDEVKECPDRHTDREAMGLSVPLRRSSRRGGATAREAARLATRTGAIGDDPRSIAVGHRGHHVKGLTAASGENTPAAPQDRPLHHVSHDAPPAADVYPRLGAASFMGWDGPYPHHSGGLTRS